MLPYTFDPLTIFLACLPVALLPDPKAGTSRGARRRDRECLSFAVRSPPEEEASAIRCAALLRPACELFGARSRRTSSIACATGVDCEGTRVRPGSLFRSWRELPVTRDSCITPHATPAETSLVVLSWELECEGRSATPRPRQLLSALRPRACGPSFHCLRREPRAPGWTPPSGRGRRMAEEEACPSCHHRP